MWTRRAFLKSGGLALFSMTLGGTPLFLGRAARAMNLNAGNRRRILVAIFQRGAMDGLMAVAPFTDSLLQTHRPRLYMSAARAAGESALIDLDGKFGLHPAFASLAQFYRENRLAIVHGVGSPDPTRSHFDAQDYMETGTPGRKGTASGWLNRAMGLLGHEATPFQAVAMTAALPRSFYGNEPALAISNLEDFSVKIPGAAAPQTTGQSLEALYESASQQLLRGAGAESFEAMRILAHARPANYLPENGANYPASALGTNLKQIAQLIKMNVGLEIAFAETGGWDTHVQQGTVNGTFARRGRDLAEAIAAFWKDIEAYHDQVVLMTMTEFGRTVRENGAGGTDHGRASCAFILGNQVAGGRVHGRVPRLAPEELEEGRDLPVTVDFRSMFAEVAAQHLGIEDTPALFPGWQAERMALFRN